MGIFTRFRDIVSSNINAMLDNTEDPEKMIRLMISEMEDTLVDMKRSCAQVMANVITVQRKSRDARASEQSWVKRASLAVENGRDDLAREALAEKHRYGQRSDVLERELEQLNTMAGEYKSDMRLLEDKLRSAREKRRILVHRHVHARRKRCAQEHIRRADGADAALRFEQLKARIDRMETEADLVDYGRHPDFDGQFAALFAGVEKEAIEAELQQLKASR